MAHPNLQPVGWHQINETEFAQSMFFIYAGDQIYLGTIYPPKADDPGTPDFKATPIHGAKGFLFHDGTGVALTRDYWAGTVQYYKFGCDHSYRGLTQDECRERGIIHHGRMFHVEECSKCHYINAYDSSD